MTGETAVDFNVIRTILVVVVTASILVPLNIPLAALAYKVQLGYKPVPMEPVAFWMRSTGVALGLTAICAAVMGMDYWLVKSLELPAGFVHAAVLLAYLPAGVWLVVWLFGMEELMEAVSVFGIYLAIPCLVLTLMLAVNFRLPVQFAESWLLPATF
jgi:hypothetical protein